MLFSSAIMWLVFGAISAYMAKTRGKNPYLWFFLGMFFGIFGPVFLFFSTRGKRPQKKDKDPTTIDVTPQYDPAHKEKLWYYLDPDQRQNGPMSFDAIIGAFRNGKVSNETLVWNETLDNWQSLKEFLS